MYNWNDEINGTIIHFEQFLFIYSMCSKKFCLSSYTFPSGEDIYYFKSVTMFSRQASYSSKCESFLFAQIPSKSLNGLKCTSESSPLETACMEIILRCRQDSGHNGCLVPYVIVTWEGLNGLSHEYFAVVNVKTKGTQTAMNGCWPFCYFNRKTFFLSSKEWTEWQFCNDMMINVNWDLPEASLRASVAWNNLKCW